jgi:putative transposase
MPDFTYVGKYHYSLTFSTFERQPIFSEASAVELVRSQFLRACAEKFFELTAYCFMPDHLHLVVRGVRVDADCRRFIALAKQYSGYAYKQQRQQRLWSRYGYERVIRESLERALTIRYLLENPVKAGLVARVADYPFTGSACYTLAELMAIAGLTAAGTSG